MSARLRRAGGPLPWLGALLALYLLAPIVAFLIRLRHGAPAAPGLGAALATSLETATVATAIIAVLGVPLAWALAHSRGRTSAALGVLVALPLALPPLMSGILLLYVVGPYTAVGDLFGGALTDSRAGIVLAQVFVSAPFLIVAARSAFAAIDPVLEDVAASLGHGPLQRFLRIGLPVAAPGVGAGLLLAWLRAFGEFGATVILAYHPASLPVFTFVQFQGTGLAATMLPVGAALAAAVLVLVTAALAGRVSPRRPATLPAPRRPAPRPPATPVGFALRKRLRGFALDVEHRAGERRLALLGPSGAGKTLTLRLLAGLARPDEGAPLEAHRRLGYVPQQPALLPRRPVWRQVTLGRHADPALAAHWLGRLGLHGLEDRLPEELSGGQQRRVALARALATEPDVLLLDEPFSGLDAPVRDRLRRELRALAREAALATVLVTHDPEEAALLADEVLVLDGGRVLQDGARAEVFARPASPQVAALLGIANTRPGAVAAPGRIRAGGVELAADTQAAPPGEAVTWCLRPERARLDPAGAYAGVLRDAVDLGTTRELTVDLGGGLELTLRTAPDEPAPEPGARCRLDIPPEAITVWRSGGASAAAQDPHVDARPQLAL